MRTTALFLVAAAAIVAALPAAGAEAADAAAAEQLSLDTHRTVNRITRQSADGERCPSRPSSKAGYHTALADSAQDLQDLTAVLHSAGWLISTSAVGATGSCWALVYCDPGKPGSSCRPTPG